jgi:hypothetical protein
LYFLKFTAIRQDLTRQALYNKLKSSIFRLKIRAIFSIKRDYQIIYKGVFKVATFAQVKGQTSMKLIPTFIALAIGMITTLPAHAEKYCKSVDQSGNASYTLAPENGCKKKFKTVGISQFKVTTTTPTTNTTQTSTTTTTSTTEKNNTPVVVTPAPVVMPSVSLAPTPK